MNAIRAVRREGDVVKLDGNTIHDFAESLRGTLLSSEIPGYDEARRIWNAMIDRRPALIARCAGTADVICAVDFARTHKLLVSVRGGGHNVAGNAVCDGGLMIDLSGMRGVHVDAKRRLARASGGATWGDFDAETQIHGLATPGGLISDTGVAGLTLGGGIGWLTPSHGLSCDNLVSLDLVTADGGLVTASAEHNPDLFWGLKGGGGNFGIVTSFEFQLHDVGPVLFGGMVLHPLDVADSVLSEFIEFMADAPDPLAGLAAFTTAPDGAPVLALIAVYNGAVSAGEAAMAPLRALGTPLADSFAPRPYRVLQTLFDAGAPPGLRYYWKSSFLDSLPPAALDTVIEALRRRPSPLTKVFLEFPGGAIRRMPRESAVFDHRLSPYNLLVIGAWDDARLDEVGREWVRELWGAMQGYASDGVYVNYLGTTEDEGADRLAEAYGPGKYDKLVELKTKYDPENMFRMNQNISPRPR